MSADEKLLALKRAAEAEMRREAPAVSSSKRLKNDDDGYVGVSRFDYSSVKLLEQGVPGLLLSSHFNREKSAIREVMAALADVWTRTEAEGGATTGTVCSADASGGTGSTPSETSPRVPAQDFEGCDQSKATKHIRSCFEVAKVSCSGLSLLINTKPTPRCLTDMTKQLILEVRGGTRPRFKHCLRLLPFQTTCPYEVGAMKDGAERAMQLARCPWTSFAVGMKARGVSNAKHPPRKVGEQESLAADEVETSHAVLDLAAATTNPVLRSGAVAKQPATASVDRTTTIELIAAAVNDIHCARGEKPPRVDLADPAVAIMVEVVPMAHAAGCILSVLEDKRLFAVKPRLQVLAVGK